MSSYKIEAILVKQTIRINHAEYNHNSSLSIESFEYHGLEVAPIIDEAIALLIDSKSEIGLIRHLKTYM